MQNTNSKSQIPNLEELLKILCCPVCHGDLHYSSEEESLMCRECKRVYKIKDGIPIMLADEDENNDPTSC